jgi:mannose-6-phosphate isomerase
MAQPTLCPLRFDPIYQYRLWGGRALAGLLADPLPGDGPIGEAWILSDREDHPSRVSDGPLKGRTLAELMQEFPDELMGELAHRFRRFPLLLKFLDVHKMLSVQVHPADNRTDLLPSGESGKTEAWVVLEAATGSRIYCGLKPGTTAAELRRSLADGTLAGRLVRIDAKVGEAVFTPAGTVHSLGGDVLVFEIQENSDVTFRLSDWGHIDCKTGQPRPLQVEQAMAAIDFGQRGHFGKSDAGLVTPVEESTGPIHRERLFDDKHFALWRLRSQSPFFVGALDTPRVLVCVEGAGRLEHAGTTYPVAKGEVWLLPAVAGICAFLPSGPVTLPFTLPVTLFEIAIPLEAP